MLTPLGEAGGWQAYPSLRDKERKGREGQGFMSGPEAISGPENSVFSKKNKTKSASSKEDTNVECGSKHRQR